MRTNKIYSLTPKFKISKNLIHATFAMIKPYKLVTILIFNVIAEWQCRSNAIFIESFSRDI
jgi:hypothetical protein